MAAKYHLSRIHRNPRLDDGVGFKSFKNDAFIHLRREILTLMKKWDLLEQVHTGDGSLMTLHTDGMQRVIRVNGRELMSTRHYNSEEQLAVVACKPFQTVKNPRVLIGGLGLGFTLRAALATVGPNAEVVVAELMPEVVAWNKNPAYGLAHDSLNDSRTRIVIDDVGNIIAQNNAGFHAIMLDTDNGTTAMSTAANAELYKRNGLERVCAALRPQGLAVYWSAGEDPLFVKLMGRCGFAVTVQKSRIHPNSGGYHYLLIGRKLG